MRRNCEMRLWPRLGVLALLGALGSTAAAPPAYAADLSMHGDAEVATTTVMTLISTWACGIRTSSISRRPFNGRIILVRFVFADIPTGSSGDERAYSQDGGRTWETNWVNQPTRELQ